MNFDCGKEVVQAVGGTGTTTCGYWGRGCTDGSTDFAAGTAAAGGAGPLTGGKFPAYEPSVRSGITSPAPFRDWNGPIRCHAGRGGGGGRRRRRGRARR